MLFLAVKIPFLRKVIMQVLDFSYLVLSKKWMDVSALSNRYISTNLSGHYSHIEGKLRIDYFSEKTFILRNSHVRIDKKANCNIVTVSN